MRMSDLSSDVCASYLLPGDGRILLDLGEAMEPNLPDVWIASDEAIEENPEAVKRALVALYSAVQYMKANPAWTVKFIQERTKSEVDVARKEFENTIMGLSDDGALQQDWVAASLQLGKLAGLERSEEHTSELQSLMRL